MGDKKRPTSQMIKVRCPNPECRKVLAVKAELAGRKGRCPICKQAMSIPKPPSGDSKQTTVLGKEPPSTRGNTVTLSVPPEPPKTDVPVDKKTNDSGLPFGSGKGFTPAIKERRMKTSQIMSFAKGQAMSDAPTEAPTDASPPSEPAPQSDASSHEDDVFPALAPQQTDALPSLEMPTQVIPAVPPPSQPVLAPAPKPQPAPQQAAASPMAPPPQRQPAIPSPGRPAELKPISEAHPSATMPTIRIETTKPPQPPAPAPAAPPQAEAPVFPEMPTQRIAIPGPLLKTRQEAPPPAPPAQDVPQQPERPRLMSRAEALQPPPLEKPPIQPVQPRPSQPKPLPAPEVKAPEQKPRKPKPHDPWASEEPIRPIDRPPTRMVLAGAGDSMLPDWLDDNAGNAPKAETTPPKPAAPPSPPPPSAAALLTDILPKSTEQAPKPEPDKMQTSETRLVPPPPPSLQPAQSTKPAQLASNPDAKKSKPAAAQVASSENSAIDDDFAEAKRVRRERRRRRDTPGRATSQTEKPKDEVVYEIFGGILSVAGPVGYDLDSRFADYCEQLLQSPETNLVVDLAKVSYLSSTYLGVIAPLYPRASDMGKTVVVRASGKVARVLRLAGFDRLGKLEEV